ncbi:hypothetical protein ACTA71_007917 [Dictyostelium dimigraforme]
MKLIFSLIILIATIAMIVSGTTTATSSTSPVTSPSKSTKELYYAIRTDVRKCAAPMCGGYFLREIGSNNKTEIYVKALNQVSSTVSESQYKNAPNFNVVVKGQITDDNIIVSEIFRLLPKINNSINIDKEIDNFYTTIVPSTGNNENTTTIEIQKLNSKKPSTEKVKSIKNSNDDIFFIPTDWLSYKVYSGQSVFTITKNKTSTTIDYMFISLPDPKFCPKILIPILCKNETVPTYTSTAMRCLKFAGCVHPGPCPFMIPVCQDGYTKSSYPSQPNACPHYSCLPSFLTQ